MQIQSFAHGQIYPYLKDNKPLMCPSDRPDSLYYQREFYLSSYIWNGAVSGYNTTTERTYKLARFRPDGILQWESDETIPVSFNDAADFPSEGFMRWHGGSRNSADPTQESGTMATVGMFDGSSKRMSSKALYQLAAGGSEWDVPYPMPAFSSVPNELWCNPGATNGALGGL